jgi:hypothetical protein
MKKKHLRVIRMIQEKIPKDLLLNLMKEVDEAPTIKKVMELALTKPDSEVSPTKKKNIRRLLASGRLDRKVMVLDHDVEKQIDIFLQEEIDLAVKLGRLPKEAPTLELLNKKGQKYARRQERRLRREFLGEGSDVVDGAEDTPKDASEHPARPVDDGLLRIPGSEKGR